MALTEYYVSVAGGGTNDGLSEANAFTFAQFVTDFNAGSVAGKRYNIKAGTYSGLSTFTATGDGTLSIPGIVRGYNSTIGDLDTPTYNANGSLVTTNYPVIEFAQAANWAASGAAYILYKNLYISVAGTGVSAATLVLGGESCVHQCYVTNPSTNASARAITAAVNCIVENCDLACTGASGAAAVLGTSAASLRAIGNRFLDAPVVGISVFSATGVILDNVFFADVTGPCIDLSHTTVTSVITVRGNTIKGAAVGIRFAAASYSALHYVGDNHVTDCGTAAVLSLQDGTAQIPAVFSHNRFRDNTANIDGFDDWASGTSFEHVTTDTGGAETDYTAAASNQFLLISGAPGVGTASVTNRDIGAMQRSSSGSSVVLGGGMQGGMNG